VIGEILEATNLSGESIRICLFDPEDQAAFAKMKPSGISFRNWEGAECIFEGVDVGSISSRRGSSFVEGENEQMVFT
jgi:hypothetical protein